MNALQFDVSMKDLPGFRADAVLGDSIFEALIEPRDVRRFRSAVIDLARIVSVTPHRRGILIVNDPHITEADRPSTCVMLPEEY